MIKFQSLVCALILLVTSCNSSNNNQYDAAILNAQMLLPNGETKSGNIYIKDGNIAEISDELYKTDNSIDAEGNFVMPGFIDAHAHFIGIGSSKANLDLLGTTSWAEVLDKVKEKVATVEPGQWIVGRGWHQEKWKDQPAQTVNGFPVHDALSAISPDHPLMLSHASGHGILVNAKAMELAGITSQTPTPEGGVILKDEDGNPTGIFQENAALLIQDIYQEAQKNKTEEEKQKDWLNLLRLAEEECLSQGITTVHDAGITFENAQRFLALAEDNQLSVRIYAMLIDEAVHSVDSAELVAHLAKTKDNPFFTHSAIKAYMDGALGSRGAWMLEDYSDKPGYRGENVTPLEMMSQTTDLAKKYNMQLCVHAIGDRGNREVINLFEEKLGAEIPQKRWRIEHAQHLNPEDIDRIAELGIIASMQTVHCTSDAPYVVKRLGEKRAEDGAYVWQSLLQKDVRIANGTDAPIERIDPFANFYAAVTRKRIGEDEAFYPNQKMSRKKALEIYTQGNAYAGFQEDWKGKIEKGYVADLVILDQNLLTCKEEEIPNTKVLYTLVDGEIKYQKPH